MIIIPEDDVLRDEQPKSKGIQTCGTLLIQRHIIPESDRKIFARSIIPRSWQANRPVMWKRKPEAEAAILEAS